MGAGSAAEGLKDYERALKYYEELARNEKSPLYPWGMLAYGRVLGLLGNMEESKKVLEDLLAQNPPQDVVADVNFYLGYFNQ